MKGPSPRTRCASSSPARRTAARVHQLHSSNTGGRGTAQQLGVMCQSAAPFAGRHKHASARYMYRYYIPICDRGLHRHGPSCCAAGTTSQHPIRLHCTLPSCSAALCSCHHVLPPAFKPAATCTRGEERSTQGHESSTRSAGGARRYIVHQLEGGCSGMQLTRNSGVVKSTSRELQRA